MVVHIVMFTFKGSADGMSKQQIARQVKERFESLRGKLSGVRKFEVGLNFNEGPAAFDLVLNSEFDSQEALQVYQVHPAHEELKAFIDPLRDKLAVVDYEL